MRQAHAAASGPFRADVLAAEFLARTESDPRPWPQVFASWPPALELTVAEHTAVKVAVIRARVFGAVLRSAQRGVRRRRA